MKLLFITGSLVHGGAERHSITLANRLAERGHECHLAYVKNDSSQLDRLQLPAAGTVRCLEAASYLDMRALCSLAVQIGQQKPSALHAANPYALMYASLALRMSRHRAPLAVTFHSNKMLNLKEHLQLALYRLFFWSAERAVFVCERQREHWQRHKVFGRTNEVIYNGIDLEQWHPWGRDERLALRRALGFADEDFVIAMSAVLRPEKNPLQLVDATAKLRLRGIPARALFIGDGPMRPQIEARARTLGVAGHVAITGLQREVRPFVAACDTAVLCSFTEALSLAAIEAMAQAKPVVHSDVGGAAELIRPGRNGFLFPVGDTGALVDRLAQLAERALCERTGARAREVVETHFSERSMIERYEKTLLELETTRSKHANVRRTAGAH